jgi:chemotaxis protein MotB
MVIAVFVILALAVAVGYYAWTLRGEHKDTVGKWKKTRTAATACSKDLSRHKKSNADLKGKLADCTQARSKQDEKQKETAVSMAGLAKNLDATRKELEELRKKRAETAKRLAAFKQLTARFKKMIDSGKLKVVFRKGRMVVKMPASVLFPSGSADLSRKGELALMEVAIILRGFSKRRFMIAGHTDNRRLESAKSRYKDNWELSTARAVRVTRFMIEARLKPANLVAAGYAQFDPVGDNRTKAGRQENRRIEIILLPHIVEVPSIPK